MKHFIYLFFLGICTFASGTEALAQDWQTFESHSTLYRSRMPLDVTEKNQTIHVSNDTMAYSGQAISIFDQRPFKNSVKNYVLKIDQTISLPMTDEEIGPLIKSELDYLKEYYATTLNGSVLSRNDLMYHDRLPGGEILIRYEDPEFGTQNARARVFFSGTSKFQQMILGPRSFMNSLSSQNYFESLRLRKGYHIEKEKLEDTWEYIISPLNIFSIRVPPETSIYMPAEPQIMHKNNVERVGLKFYDPIWKHVMFYNVYGYDIDKKLFYDWVENMLQQKFVLKHQLRSERASLRRYKDENGIPTVSAEYFMKPPEEFPYMNRVKLKAQFVDGHAIVHEIMGTHRFIRGPMSKTVMDQVVFHLADPDKANEIIDKHNEKAQAQP